PRGARIPGSGRKRSVRRRLAVADASELREHPEVEVRLRPEVEVDVEAPSPPVEILVQLAAEPLDRLGRTEDARPVRARELLQLPLRARVEADAAEAAVGDA